MAGNSQSEHHQQLLATALEHHKSGRLPEAGGIYREILAHDRWHADSLHLLGLIEKQNGNHQAAIDLISSAIAINGTSAAYYSNLGAAYNAQGDAAKAVDCYRRAIALKPDYAEAHANLGNALSALNRLGDAISSYRQALALKPDFVQAGFGLASAQLLQGDFASGWKNFEWRWQTPGHTPMRRYPQPLWNGNPLHSGRLLLWPEAGVGDQVMYAGLIPEVIAAGTRCVVDCDPRLKTLFARSFPEADVVASNYSAGYIPAPDVAAHLPLGSLPGLLRNRLESFASVKSPYLFAAAGKLAEFRERYSRCKRVAGLAWYTNNAQSGMRRSIELSALSPLFAREDIHWVSLQYGAHDALEGHAKTSRAPILIDRQVNQFDDLDTFAAQIAALDLVITIDNSTAHLAGALGVPVWLMLPFSPEPRWLLNREDSPWYPSMRLFRQSAPGNWNSVVQRVASAL